MALSNQDIVARAKELAAGADGLKRRSALCVAVACRETGTLGAARKTLDLIGHRDVRLAAHRLDELAGVSAAAPDDGQQA